MTHQSDDGSLLREMIALRAYHRYLEHGREDGHDVEDWLAAEEEVPKELAAGTLQPPTLPVSWPHLRV